VANEIKEQTKYIRENGEVGYLPFNRYDVSIFSESLI
jgi:hypothetical protein